MQLHHLRTAACPLTTFLTPSAPLRFCEDLKGIYQEGVGTCTEQLPTHPFILAQILVWGV